LAYFKTIDLFDYAEYQEKCQLMIILIDKVKDYLRNRPIADFSKLLSVFRDGEMNYFDTAVGNGILSVHYQIFKLGGSENWGGNSLLSSAG